MTMNPNSMLLLWDYWRVTMVGRGSRLPCSDLDDSDDDVLSIGPGWGRRI